MELKLNFDFGNGTNLLFDVSENCLTDLQARQSLFRTVINALKLSLGIDLDPKLRITKALPNGKEITLLRPRAEIPHRSFQLGLFIGDERLQKNGLNSLTYGKRFPFQFLLEQNPTQLERVLTYCFMFGEILTVNKAIQAKKEPKQLTPEKLAAREAKILEKKEELRVIKAVRERHKKEAIDSLVSLVDDTFITKVENKPELTPKQQRLSELKAAKAEHKAANAKG